MQKLFFTLLMGILLINITPAQSDSWIQDCGTYIYIEGTILNDIPEIVVDDEDGETDTRWEFIQDVAQYKHADWNNVIGRAKNITVFQAKKIAEADPSITYFFFVKGYQMILENNDVVDPYTRVFYHGDAVFFSGAPWWGSAPGLADGYVKKNVK